MAVLTFANLTGNPADEWIGQGIAESLTIDFAKVHGLKAIPREQMFDVQRELSNAQGRVVDERQAIELGRRLGATWVVGGAVQRLGERVRLTAQTIAVDEGRSVSTVKLDGAMDHIFELQDQLVEELVRQGLQRELEQSEKRAIGRRRPLGRGLRGLLARDAQPPHRDPGIDRAGDRALRALAGPRPRATSRR